MSSASDRRCLDELNSTRYTGAQETMSTGNADDPAVQPLIRVGKSGQWLADHRHEARRWFSCSRWPTSD